MATVNVKLAPATGRSLEHDDDEDYLFDSEILQDLRQALREAKGASDEQAKRET